MKRKYFFKQVCRLFTKWSHGEDFLEKMSPFTKHIDGRAMGADILCTAQTNLELQTVVISLADIWDLLSEFNLLLKM